MTNFKVEKLQNYKKLESENFRMYFMHVSECLHV